VVAGLDPVRAELKSDNRSAGRQRPAEFSSNSVPFMKALLPPACLAILCGLLAACETARSAPPQQSEYVDSIIPRAEALRRFQAGLSEPHHLANASPTRDDLVRRFVRALEKRDTTALTSMILRRDEFAFLYYPTNPQSLPPYDLSPGLMWFLFDGATTKGLAHTLEERGGKPLGYLGYKCEGTASAEGANKIWAPCVVMRRQASGDTISERLFGPIIERNGEFKFVSLANKL
jgi:hypothetical protein